MSAIYLLIVFAVWVGLTWALWRLWWRWRVKEGGNRLLRDTLAFVIGALWLGASFWYAGGQTYYYDAQVNRLCAQDGGIKIYETVKLPKDKFNEWGQPNFFRPTQGENALGPEYVYRSEDRYYREGNPALIRYHHQVIRRSSGAVLGEAVSYGRGGGDLPGPWAPSNYHCPPTSESSEIALFKRVFFPTNRE